MVAKTIVVGNFKGGVGKTKVAVMASWELSHVFNKKVLLIDMDPQANASMIIARSAGIESIDVSIMDGFQEGDLTSKIMNVTENLLRKVFKDTINFFKS